MKSRKRFSGWVALALASVVALWVLATAQTPSSGPEQARLQELRNLGKALYETPGSSRQAVEVLMKRST